MWKFQVNDIYKALQPLYIFTTVLGLSGYNLTEKAGKKLYKVSVFRTIRIWLQYIIIYGVALYNTCYNDSPIYNENISISNKVSNYQKMILCAGSAANIFFGCLFSSKICDCINKIDLVDNELKQCGIRISYK